MKATAPPPKTRLPATPELALHPFESIPGSGENGPPSGEQADDEAQAGGDVVRPNARYTGGNVYDFINAQPTL